VSRLDIANEKVQLGIVLVVLVALVFCLKTIHFFPSPQPHFLPNGDEVVEVDGIPVANKKKLAEHSKTLGKTMTLSVKGKDGKIYNKEVPVQKITEI
jgi:PDZ domain-containing secreted protein